MTREEYEKDLNILYTDARKQGNTKLALEILECKRVIDTKTPLSAPDGLVGEVMNNKTRTGTFLITDINIVEKWPKVLIHDGDCSYWAHKSPDGGVAIDEDDVVALIEGKGENHENESR